MPSARTWCGFRTVNGSCGESGGTATAPRHGRVLTVDVETSDFRLPAARRASNGGKAAAWSGCNGSKSMPLTRRIRPEEQPEGRAGLTATITVPTFLLFELRRATAAA